MVGPSISSVIRSMSLQNENVSPKEHQSLDLQLCPKNWSLKGRKKKFDSWFSSKITADGDCSHEIKRRLLLGRKVMTNLHSIFKSRDITFPTKVRLVKAKVFPVITYECESWTVKKAERQRIDAFELWCWRRLLRIPWTARRSKQSMMYGKTNTIL